MASGAAAADDVDASPSSLLVVVMVVVVVVVMLGLEPVGFEPMLNEDFEVQSYGENSCDYVQNVHTKYVFLCDSEKSGHMQKYEQISWELFYNIHNGKKS